MLKIHTPFCLLHNIEWNAWAADNLAPLDMPFLSIIA